MTENEFMLADRIAKIKAINEKYDLLNNSYIAFSGGRDSTVLHHLIDLALPENKIPRVYTNTGIEYNAVVEFVKELAETDERIVIIKPSQNIKSILEEKGYPFKSKEHSEYVALYQNGGQSKTPLRYLTRGGQFECPKKLKYQFTPDFKIKVSDKCCKELKKKPSQKWAKENNKTCVMTGMQAEEGGQRGNIPCTTFKENNLKRFHPLLVVTDEWEKWFIQEYKIKLCKLYYPPYNFKRTGCKGCPYSLNLERDLQTMRYFLPNEAKQCETIWKPIYDEYRRIGYRLKPIEPSLFEDGIF